MANSSCLPAKSTILLLSQKMMATGAIPVREGSLASCFLCGAIGLAVLQFLTEGERVVFAQTYLCGVDSASDLHLMARKTVTSVRM